MYDKNRKRHFAYEALVLLGLLALLTYITRLWPILLLIILGIFIAVLLLLFLSSQKVEPVQPMLLLPPPAPLPTETDMQAMAYTLIQRRITQILQAKFPSVRWVWENPNAKEDIMAGTTVFVLLNRAGGYRRGRVVIRELIVMDVVFDETSPKKDPTPDPVDPPPAPPKPPVPTPVDDEDDEDDLEENFGLVAFQWVEAHILELSAICNEELGQGKPNYLIPAEELPVSESWEDICKELARNDLPNASCCDEGILIEFEQ